MRSFFLLPVLIFLLLFNQLLYSSVVCTETVADSSIVKIPLSVADDELVTIDDVTPELSLEGRVPLLLIHGWSFDAIPAAPGTGYWEGFKNFVLNDPELKSYFKIYYVKYWSNAVSINQLGGLLRDKIELAGFHEKPIAIIAHSMGGLVSRSFMSEYSYHSGVNEGKKCGENVKLLITLGTAHHGSPMANGPARDDKVGILLKITMSTLEKTVFSDINYSEVNRSDMRWDNYDNLLNYSKFPNEKNDWLTNLNLQTDFDRKIICYSATVTGVLILPPYTTVEESYKVGSYLMKQSFNFNNDGIVPFQSSTFAGHSPKKIRPFKEYNHADIVRGKNDGTELFNPMKEDLLEVVPPQLIWPVDARIFLKHSQPNNILWKTPSTMQRVNIYFSGDHGNSYDLLAYNIDANLSSYQWSVPDTNLTQCLIKITNAEDENEFTCSTNTFTIYNNKVVFENPIVKSYFAPNRINTISWKQEGIASKVKLTYHDPTNNFEKVIATDVLVSQQTNTYEWAIDNSVPPTNSAFLTIELLNLNELYADNEIYSFHSAPFMMLAEPEIVFLSPASFPKDELGVSGVKYVIGSTNMVRWRTEGEIKYQELSLCDSAKNVIQVIATRKPQPGINVKSMFNWKIPEVYGDKFYLLIEGGLNQDSISTIAYTPYPFRINRNSGISYPVNFETGVSLFPCIEFYPDVNSTGYSIEIVDSISRGDEFSRSYSSNSPVICLPKTIENELLPGISYQLIARTMFDTVGFYPTLVYFQTSMLKPQHFQTIAPVKGDTTEGLSLLFEWNHAVGAQEYQIDVFHQKKLLYTETVSLIDTSILVDLGKSGLPDTLFWEVTARNNYGETTAQSYFFKKNRTDKSKLTLEENSKFKLINYPNPFDTETTLEFILPFSTKTSSAEIIIYDLTGKKIRTFSVGKFVSGKQKIIWDGKNELGRRVEKGIYFACLTVDNIYSSRSIIAK